MKINNLKMHPFSRIMPSLSNEEFKSLENDIRKNGIKKPLDISEDNEILDGYHRFKIAEKLGINEIPTSTIETGSEKEKKLWIIKSNLLRRNLSTAQKYKLYAEISKLYEMGWGGDRRGEKFSKGPMGLLKTAETVGESKRTVKRETEQCSATS